MTSIVRLLKKILPAPCVRIYHFALSFLGAAYYRFPSRGLVVIAITGTKGKTTTSELVNAILEEAGYKIALSNGIRFKIGNVVEKNLFKMTMPGRFFLQRFLGNAVRAGCTHAIIEMTSEGAAQYRHKFIALDALIFTNLAPEHIESHGSYEKYLDAKLSIARALEKSKKPNRTIVANMDDKEGVKFLAVNIPNKIPYSLNLRKSDFLKLKIPPELPGEFNKYNILAAVSFTRSIGVKPEDIKRAIQNFRGVPGRMEYVREGQPFDVIVDYAHTPDSLKSVYFFLKESLSTHTNAPNAKLICILGSTGGGRDKWKRPAMGSIAAEFCDTIILTDEDPYDEKPHEIIDEIAAGIYTLDAKRYTLQKILDRRLAIRTALERARVGDVVVITGKGTDPFIMGPNGTKQVWSDTAAAQEELHTLKKSL